MNFDGRINRLNILEDREDVGWNVIYVEVRQTRIPRDVIQAVCYKKREISDEETDQTLSVHTVGREVRRSDRNTDVAQTSGVCSVAGAEHVAQNAPIIGGILGLKDVVSSAFKI